MKFGQLALIPPSPTMEAQKPTRQSSNRTHQPRTPRQQTARSAPPHSQRGASNGRIPPIIPPPDPPHTASDSPGRSGKDPPSPSPASYGNNSPVPTTTVRTKWTAGDLWSLTLAVHDKQPYTAKHTEKAGRWDEVRDIVNENGGCGRSTKSYQAQMKRLLLWQQGSTVL